MRIANGIQVDLWLLRRIAADLDALSLALSGTDLPRPRPDDVGGGWRCGPGLALAATAVAELVRATGQRSGSIAAGLRTASVRYQDADARAAARTGSLGRWPLDQTAWGRGAW
ncbi:MAG TPA: hypothetical protein VF163_09195 [Micromonosporaceae bacterium]